MAPTYFSPKSPQTFKKFPSSRHSKIRPSTPFKPVNSLSSKSHPKQLPIRHRRFTMSPTNSPTRARPKQDEEHSAAKSPKSLSSPIKAKDEEVGVTSPKSDSSPMKSKPTMDEADYKTSTTPSSSPPSTPKRRQSSDDSPRPKKSPKLSPSHSPASALTTPPPIALEENEEEKPLSPPAPKTPGVIKVSPAALIYRRRVLNVLFQLQRMSHLAKGISGKWGTIDGTNEIGMYNPNILCYRNSTLQACLHLPKWCNYFLDQHKPDDCVMEDKTLCIACRLRTVVLAYWKGDSSATDKSLAVLHSTCKQLGWTSHDNQRGRNRYEEQQDPSELYTFMANKMKEQLRATLDPLDACQQFYLRERIICPQCGPTSDPQDNQELTLNLNLRPQIPNGSLNDYIKLRFADPEIAADYKCPNCGNNTDKKMKKYKILHAPDILVVCLMRYTDGGEKIRDSIPFSTTLDLNQYRIKRSRRNAVYTLTSVVCHKGLRASSGHYVCAAKAQDGTWGMFDDVSVKTISEEQAVNPGNGKHSSFTPYMLYYSRVSSKKKEQPEQEVIAVPVVTNPKVERSGSTSSEGNSQSAESPSSSSSEEEGGTSVAEQPKEEGEPDLSETKEEGASKVEKEEGSAEKEAVL